MNYSKHADKVAKHKSIGFDDLVLLQDEILQSLFRCEADPRTGDICSQCGENLAFMRCRDCWNPQVLCKACLVQMHAHNPFHNVEQWQNGHFSRTSLLTAGLILYLGHQGTCCPLASASQKHILRIIDINGIQECAIVYCMCPSCPQKALQLIQSGFFPSSVKMPHTIFAHRVLKDFHIDNTSSHTAVQNYAKKLQCLTNRAFPEEVPVCIMLNVKEQSADIVTGYL